MSWRVRGCAHTAKIAQRYKKGAMFWFLFAGEIWGGGAVPPIPDRRVTGNGEWRREKLGLCVFRLSAPDP